MPLALLTQHTRIDAFQHRLYTDSTKADRDDDRRRREAVAVALGWIDREEGRQFRKDSRL